MVSGSWWRRCSHQTRRTAQDVCELREALTPFSSVVPRVRTLRRGVPGFVLDSVIALPAAAMVLVASMGDAKTLIPSLVSHSSRSSSWASSGCV